MWIKYNHTDLPLCVFVFNKGKYRGSKMKSFAKTAFCSFKCLNAALSHIVQQGSQFIGPQPIIWPWNALKYFTNHYQLHLFSHTCRKVERLFFSWTCHQSNMHRKHTKATLEQHTRTFLVFWEGLKGLNVSALFRRTFPLVHRLFQGTEEIFPCHVTWHFSMLIGLQACKCGRPSGRQPVAAQSLSIPKPFGQEEKQWCLEPLRDFYLCEPARLCDWL